MLLFTNRFSRRADIYAVTAAEITLEGTANILINRYTPLGGCPRSIRLDNGLQFCSKLSHAVYKMLAFVNLPPAPTTQMAMAGWSV